MIDQLPYKMSKYSCFSIILALLTVAACDNLKTETRQVFTQDDTAVEVIEMVEILYSDSAIVRVKVTGPLMYNYSDRENPRQQFPNGVRLDFLEPDLSVKSTLTAKTAVRLTEKGQIIARDSVVFHTREQETLETEELTWDEKTAKVHTDKFVKVTRPGEIIYGYGLEAEQDFSYWKILVPKGRIKVDKLNQALQ